MRCCDFCVRLGILRPVVVITGSGGPIGARLGAALDAGFEVVGLAVERPDWLRGRVTIACDLRSDESVESAFDEPRFAPRSCTAPRSPRSRPC
jgi:hypothetical protein